MDTSFNSVRRSSCQKRKEAANNAWSAAYSVQWTRRFRYVSQLVDQVLTWPHIESTPPPTRPPDNIRVRLAETVATDEPSAFLSARSLAGYSWQFRPSIWLCHWYVLTGRSSAGGPSRITLRVLADAGRSGSGLHAKRRTGARSLQYPFLSVVPFCVRFSAENKVRWRGLSPNRVTFRIQDSGLKESGFRIQDSEWDRAWVRDRPI